jgi:hypothetical protein
MMLSRCGAIAVLESDWSIIEERIEALESAIKGRLRRHAGRKSSDLDAVNRLNGLRAEVASWRASKGAS